KNAEIRINNTKKALEKLGFDKRLRLEWISASEGLRFSEVIRNFTEEIKKLGKNPVKTKIELQVKADERRSNASAVNVQGSEESNE
ncbi:MAG: hydrogenase iron-sulfur subunit, partial [Candidatus Methanoperedens sp.]|nr:hydrogenase iron-sulfur subunit [Candidatus Methanoperedens sp.]